MSNTTAFPGLSDLASAITQAEGVDPTYNNPGALSMGDVGFGTFGQNLTIYPDTVAGQNALENQLAMIGYGQSKVYNPNTTLQQMGQAWAGGGTGSQNWVKNVANYLGVDPNSTIGSILLGKPGTQGTETAGTAASGNPMQMLGNLWNKIPDIRDIGKGTIVSTGKAVEDLLFTSRAVMLVVGIILIGAGALGFILPQAESIVSGATQPVHAAGRISRRIGSTTAAAAEITAL